MLLEKYNKDVYRGRISKEIGWIYGFPFKNKKGENFIFNFNPFLVEKDTLQQCTGVYDKNNVPIFEGDLCINAEEENSYLLCKYLDEISAFVFMTFSDTLVNWNDDYIETFPYLIVKKEQQNYEICGNIIDNPELFYNSNS